MSKIDTTNMTLEERMETAREISKGYFREGLNCTECVMRTFMDMHDTGMPDDIIKLASGFGGGIGHTKSVCGAITGAVLALGMVKGRDPFESEEVKDRIQELYGGVYPAFGAMVDEATENFGTIICKELSDPHGDFEGKERKRNCKQLIMYSAALAEKHAAK